MMSRMVKRVLAVAMAGCMTLSSFAVGSTKAEAKATGSKTGWTFNVYMCGADLESDSAQASKDLVEMMSAKKMPDNVRIVIQTGGCREWHYKSMIELYYANELLMNQETIEKINTPNISNEYIQRYEMKFDNVIEQDGVKITYPSLVLLSENEGVNAPKKAKELGETAVSMGDAATLADFVKDVDSDYDHNALILWNHGGGTEDGVCADDYFPGRESYLSLMEINDALTDAKESIPNGQYDMIGYDACLMASFETLAMTSRFAKYTAASMTLEAGDGWDYTPIMNALAENASNPLFTGAELSKSVVDAYEIYYLSEKAKKEGLFDGDAFMGAYDLSKIGSIIAKFDEMAQVMIRVANDPFLSDGFLEAGYKATKVEDVTDLVSLSSFLKKTISYTTKFVKDNEADKSSIVQRSVRLANRYIEKAQAFRQSVFEEGFQLKQIYGDEKGRYGKEMGISLYYPQKDSADDGVYADTDYGNLGISEAYQMYATWMANAVIAIQSVPVDASLSYNTAKASYNLKLTQGNLDAVAGIYVEGYIKVDGKACRVRYMDLDRKKNNSFQPFTSYATFNGLPIYMRNKEDWGGYKIFVKINDGDPEPIYVYQQGKEFWAYEDYAFETGDKITPVKIINNDFVPYKKGSYIVKEKDIDEEGDTRLPIKTVTDKEHRMYIQSTVEGFRAGVITQSFFHSDIVAFTKAKATLSKKTFVATGEKICPKVTVKSGKTILKKGKDYKLVYTDNLGAGKASVKVVGLGKYQYAPAKRLYFTIKVNKN